MVKKAEKEMDTSVSFEESVAKLEEIVRSLEKGDLTLDLSLEQFENGIKWAHLCEQKLNEAKGRVEMLVKKEGGKGETVPFEVKEG